MSESKKELIVAGNWKMHKTSREAKEWLKIVTAEAENLECKIIVCTPFTDIPVAVSLTQTLRICIGAQNCHFEDFGAYTGEISAQMLQEIGIKYVILGHSERRKYFLETDEIINKKIKSAIKSGLKVIFCVGETLQEREFKVIKEKISTQIKKGLYQISKKEIENVVIAYEPIWAIGTGKNATKDEVEAACKAIKQTLSCMYGFSIAEKISIIYGGSVNVKNAKEFFQMENINGVLIGGASLDADEFLKIANCAPK